jgi:hypothetical protein
MTNDGVLSRKSSGTPNRHAQTVIASECNERGNLSAALGIAASHSLLAMTTTIPSLRANIVSAAISYGGCLLGLGKLSNSVGDLGLASSPPSSQ